MRGHVFRKIALLSIAAAGACGVTDEGEDRDAAPPAIALTEVRAHAREALDKDGTLAAQAAAYARRQVAGLGAKDTFELRRSGVGPDGEPYVRLMQLHGGLPVFGAEVVVHGKAGALTSVGGNVVPHLEGLPTTPALEAIRALGVAKSRYLAKVTDRTAALSYAREHTRLVILPRSGEAPRLAWHVEFFTEQQGGVAPGLWSTFVDAVTGELLLEFNGIDGLSQASGPGGNPRIGRSWVNALDVEPFGTTGLYQMSTARLTTYDLHNGTSGGTIVTGPLGPIGDAAINDAHGFAEIVLNMLLDWHGQNSIDNAGFKIVSRVHYGAGYDNAFWDGSQMTYGDGSSLFYPLSGSIDVVAHEIDHGFTTFHSNLIYSGQSGGMNESFSDIAGETAEAFYLNAAPDWNVGRDIMRSGNGLRFMCDPRADGVSIDHISQYTSGVDVHHSSGIMNKAFCRTARRLASGSPTGAATLASVKRASRAWYVANILYWTPSSTFQQGCQGVYDAATALGYTAAELGHLQQSWTDVGITCGATAPAAVSFAISDASANEGDTLFFTVTKTGNDGLSHSMSFATADGTATSTQDYTATSGTLTFAPGDTSKTISVPTRSNRILESDEFLNVNLGSPTNGGTLTDPQGRGTIFDVDPCPSC